MKKFLSLALALVMCLSLVTISAGAKDFTDDSKITYGEAVDVISELGIVGGYDTGDFKPTDTLTRGAAAKIICNLLLGPTAAEALGVSSAPFKDVPAGHTFAGYIAYCSQQGIINGYTDGSFRPAGQVTGFQFLKMLLGALGYDGTIEGFTGNNWTTKVASLAIDTKLTDGNDEFVGSVAMSREEACLYALNTLKASLVDYDNKGTQINIDGVIVSVGASKAQAVTTGATNTIYGVKADGHNYFEFAEKYFPRLKLTSAANTDSFERPANSWNYKTNSIGTYAQSADLTYTEEVKIGTIYSDLGLGATIAAANVDFHVDGAVEGGTANDNSTALTSLALTKGSGVKIGGNGVLTEVFYDDSTSPASVTVTMVNTYAGEVTSKRAATSSADASVTITPMNASKGGNYETTDFAVDDAVLYTYSNKSGDTGVKSVVPAEQVTGTLTGYTAGKSVTVGGETYKLNKAATIGDLSGAVKYEVTLTLDAYGYVVDVNTDETSTNYAVVLKYSDKGTWDDAKARLLFTDGETKDVNLTDNVDALTGGAGTDVKNGSIVSYKVNNKDKYELTVLREPAAIAASTTGVTTKGSVTIAVDSATVANGKTIFLVATKSGSDTTYSAYTGIANVPTISTGATAASGTAYTKSGTAATVVYIDATVANISVSTSTKDVIFVKGSDAGSSYDSVKGTYWTYDAIVNGEITTIDSATPITTPAMYTTAAYDANNVVTLSGSDGVTNNGKGTVREANGAIGLNGTFYSYADDCQVFYIDSDGNISTSSINGISTDESDTVWFKVADGEVTTIVIKDVVATTSGYKLQAVTADGNTGSELTVTSGNTDAKTIATSDTVTVATDKTVGLTVTAHDDGATVTVTPAQALVASTTSYVFTVTATSESGVTTSCDVTVTFTAVNA